jgi:adenylate cyclase class IV
MFKDQSIEVVKSIFYEAKIKIQKSSIEQIEKKLEQLGFKKEESIVERDIVIFSDDQHYLKIKEKEEGREKFLLLVFNKEISNKSRQTFFVKFPKGSIYRGIFEKFIKTFDTTDIFQENFGDTNIDRLDKLKVVRIEKIRIPFYDLQKGASITIDLDVVKKENEKTIYLGNFIEITTNSEDELTFFLQQFREFGEVTFTHYYKMKNDFFKSVRN